MQNAGVVQVWRLPNLVQTLTLKGHRRGVWSAQFSPVDQCVLTGSGDATIRLWALADGSCLRTFEGHGASVLRSAFVSAGTQVRNKHTTPIAQPAEEHHMIGPAKEGHLFMECDARVAAEAMRSDLADARCPGAPTMVCCVRNDEARLGSSLCSKVGGCPPARCLMWRLTL